MCNYNGIRVSRNEFIRLKEIEKELKHLNSLKPLASDLITQTGLFLNLKQMVPILT